jgi:HEXXH motif-containing protein
MASDTLPAGMTRHRLPAAYLSALALGEGSSEITRYFLSTEYSRRVLLIDTLLREVERQPALLGPLPSVVEVRGVLAAAQKAAPDEVATLLTHPHVGSWAAYTLRRHRGGASSGLPLWIDFGGLHALVLVAAARAGLRWSTHVPLRNREAMLPTLGMARFPASAADHTIAGRTEGGQIWLSDGRHELAVPTMPPHDVEPVDDSGWWALRRVRVGDELPLTVWLDDLDPLRDLADPVPPMRLDAATFDRWRELLADAWALLCRDHRANAEAIAEGVVSVVPLRDEPGWETRSASNGEAFGSVMVAEPPDAVTLAVALVHEYQHIALGALLHLIRLNDSDDGLYYAPWRDDPRPLPGLFQGVYAFLGIARFFRRHRQTVSGSAASLASFEYAYARGQTAEALETVLATTTLTEEGRSFVEGLRIQMKTWDTDQIDPEIARLAMVTAEIHRVGWRLRHCQPPPGEATDLAHAWLTGDRAEVTAPMVRPHADMRWEQRIPALARRRARALGAGDDHAAPTSRDSLTLAENRLVTGDLAVARTGFLTAIAALDGQSPEGVRAWAGLAAATRDADIPAARALSQRPDLVRAVHAELCRLGKQADPLAIAAWLTPRMSR